MRYSNDDAERLAGQAYGFFQANKTFSLTAFRIFMGINVREANMWIAGAVRTGMVKKLGNENFQSTGDFITSGIAIKVE